MHDILRQSIERFVPLTEEEWQMLLPYVETKEYKKHEHFAEQGKVANEIGFVVEGMLRHYYLKDGEEKTTYFYFENHFVSSYISCISRQPSLLAIETLSECRMLVFPYSKMKELFQKSITWQSFGRLIAEYLAMGLEERMVGLLMLSPEERYMQLIEGNKKKIMERIPQHYIANYLGITPVSLSRIRNRMIKK
ncbi:MAG: Crp/Fnr family transcriptional regulator [Cytophagaceae bacterium]